MAGRLDSQIRCSFLQQTTVSGAKLIGTGGSYICDECVGFVRRYWKKNWNMKKARSFDDITVYKPEEIKAFLDEYVIGQEQAKGSLCSVYNHYKRIMAQERSGRGTE